MIKHPHRHKNYQESPNKNKKASTLSVMQFFKKSKEIVKEKSDVALNKLHGKIIEDPAVYKLPLGDRKKVSSQGRSPEKEDKSLSKPKLSEPSRSKPQLSQQESKKLGELMKKKNDLMNRLRKIDQQLHNPSMLPVTFESNSNSSFTNSEHDRVLSHKINESKVNFKQKNTYNVYQHEKTVEMLTRLNNQKMRRQQKIVSDMKKKQEKEIKKLEEIQRDKSKVHLSRQRYVQPARVLNKKQTSKLLDTQSAQSSPSYIPPAEKQTIPNQFEDIQESLQIGTHDKVPTEQAVEQLPQINQ